MTGAPEQPGIHIEGVSKRFGSLWAVRDVSLQIRPGEFFSLLGPSGCGKTTLLRTIAGFEQPDGGRIYIGDQDVTRRRPQDRPTAMVFQNYALFPTMTVEENVAYGLAARRMRRGDQKARVADVLGRVDLAGLERKPVTALSGGQQQRVALARAIAVQPSVLLFDEPLSNLDVALREQTRREIKEIQASLGTTSVYVTHDQQEALAMSDRIGVMRAGRLVEVGTPEVLYNEPNRAYVAQFFGSNVVRDHALAQRLTGEEAPEGMVLSVRPEHVVLSSGSGVQARVLGRQFLGTVAEWWLEANGQQLRAWVDPGHEPVGEIGIEAARWRWVEDEG
ncbi:MAG TPA: ABC transporter ATP-binding protein [Rhodothermales bacterium]|nr:ABC transporter ATP-binding protein [Rhodothermales bacterium]